MGLGDQVRDFDNFGAPVSLNFSGRTTFGTQGGGIASLCLFALTLGYLVIQVMALISYKDPVISSYEILEKRS